MANRYAISIITYNAQTEASNAYVTAFNKANEPNSHGIIRVCTSEIADNIMSKYGHANYHREHIMNTVRRHLRRMAAGDPCYTLRFERKPINN